MLVGVDFQGFICYTYGARGETNMKIKYRTIDLRSISGFYQAEKLKALGWKIGNIGLNTIQMYREIK